MLTLRSALAPMAALVLLLGACGDDDNGDSSGGTTASQDDAGSSDDGSSDAPPGGSGGGTATFGGEEITIERVRCFFEEQPRAGLGGVFTHTAQADAANGAGEAIVIDMSRARSEDGEVSDGVSFDVGDPVGEEFIGYSGGGPEGTIEFGDNGVSATDVEMTNFEDFQGEPVLLSFELSC